MARARAGPAGIAVVRIVSVAGATTAAPSPWIVRAAISSSGVVASPPARPAIANTARPAAKVRLRPNRSAVRPPSSRNPAKVRM
ncbi:hypothetical protein GCM10010412_097730 [Nonomuraea recticatena]|uniref:Uncharacterized protein n=1 Tax=Nonomuraea recticatena TaxID=46178 RepID=A0ABP6FVA9_9ACTN